MITDAGVQRAIHHNGSQWEKGGLQPRDVTRIDRLGGLSSTHMFFGKMCTRRHVELYRRNRIDGYDMTT